MKLPENVGAILLVTSESHIDENFYYVTQTSKSKHVTAAAIINTRGVTVLTNRLEHGLFGGRKIVADDRLEYEKMIRQHAKGTVGMNLSYLPANALARYRKIVKGRVVDISEFFEEKRAIKNKNEIKKIKEAVKITTNALSGMEKILKRSRTERELALHLSHEAHKNGAEDIAFPTIVASRTNSALPHHSPTNAKLRKGILLVDFGVVSDGYCSDMTRTFFIGRADERTKYVYDTVYRAQKAGIEKMKSGAKACHMHNAAGEIIKKELGQEMVHSFGHGLGIRVHDFPSGVWSKTKFALRKGMVMTAEPGYYEKKWGGIRIEDDVLIGKKGIPMSKAQPTLEEL